jgi:biopolymer transport protein ExbD
MARTFKRQRGLHPVAELNITNMVDLGFTLLIIFMIATPLIQQNQSIPLDLPVVHGTSQQKKPEEAQLVTVDRNGNYYWSGRRTNLAQMRVNLAALAEMPKPPVIRIEADFTLQYQQVVSVLDEVKRVGLSRISLDTQVSK